MGAFRFGTDASFGRDVYLLTRKAAIAFAVAGAVRSGINEGLEQTGAKDDGIDFAEGILYYGWENVKDICNVASSVLDKIKDNPDEHVQLNVDKHGNLKSVQIASNKPDLVPGGLS